MFSLAIMMWERVGWIMISIALGWLFAKVWSHRERWAHELDSDRLWVRTCCIAGGLVPLLQLWSLLAIPLLVLAHKDAEMKAEKEHRRNLERMAHNKWWSETQFRWERKWERIPRNTR